MCCIFEKEKSAGSAFESRRIVGMFGKKIQNNLLLQVDGRPDDQNITVDRNFLLQGKNKRFLIFQSLVNNVWYVAICDFNNEEQILQFKSFAH